MPRGTVKQGRSTLTVVPLEEAGITPDPHSARRHTPRNIAVIEDSMQTDGAGRSILVDQDGVTIAGAGAWEAATQAGIRRAAVIETDGDTLVIVKRTVTPEQRLRLALADNRATDLSTWDVNRLQALQAQAPELLRHLWTEQELAELIAQASDPADGLTDPDAVPDARPTTIQRGDLFTLGAHRLLCGDSTDATDVARVLDGTPPLLMVTDPPYGVDYDPAWRAKAGVNRNTKKLGTVANDDRADWADAWRLFTGDVADVRPGPDLRRCAELLPANGSDGRHHRHGDPFLRRCALSGRGTEKVAQRRSTRAGTASLYPSPLHRIFRRLEAFRH